MGLSYEAQCTFVSGTKSASSGALNDDANGDGRESVRIDPIVEFARASTASTVTRCSIDVIVSHQLQGK